MFRRDLTVGRRKVTTEEELAGSICSNYALILSQCRDFSIGVIWRNLEVLVIARAVIMKNKLMLWVVGIDHGYWWAVYRYG